MLQAVKFLPKLSSNKLNQNTEKGSKNDQMNFGDHKVRSKRVVTIYIKLYLCVLHPVHRAQARPPHFLIVSVISFYPVNSKHLTRRPKNS